MMLCLANSAEAQNTLIPDIDEIYLTKLVEIAKLNYPRVKTYESRVKIAESNVAKSKLAYFDIVSVTYIYQPRIGQNGGAVATPAVGLPTTGTTAAGTVTAGYNYFNGFQVGVFLNPSTFLQKPQNVKIEKQNLNIALNDQAEYLVTLRADIKKLYYAYLERVALLKVEAQNTALQEQLVSSLKTRFEKGEATFEAYNSAIAALGAQNQRRVSAEVAFLTARTDLETLLGNKLENIK